MIKVVNIVAILLIPIAIKFFASWHSLR
jgi:hypothetical protein